jgi:hypothetical protein
METASSSSLKRVTVTTGPKISSRTMRMSLVTSVNKVGATQKPSLSSGSAGSAACTASFAPSSIPIWM